MSAPTVVYTIGYQGRNLDEFVSALTAAQVDLVIDLRSRPMSRRRGFSKSQLAAHLGKHGISYRHLPELGMPIDLLPHRSPRDGNAQILETYRHIIVNRDEELETLLRHATSATVCLLCFEANANHCHRGIVADQLRKRWRFDVRHL
jgi:uncharacterized protein (DUF488 family)